MKLTKIAVACGIALSAVLLPSTASAAGPVTLQKIYNFTNQGTADVGDTVADYASVQLCHPTRGCISAVQNVTHVWNRTSRQLCLYSGANFQTLKATAPANGAVVVQKLGIRSHRPC